MKLRNIWLILMLVALLAAWGCSDDDDPVAPQPEDNFAAIAAEASAYVNDSVDCPGVINADDLFNQLAAYEVVDIRSAADFALGHIEGAINVPSLATLLDDVAAQSWAMDQPIAVVCYSGQTAGFAKIALELAGYTETKSLLFGMCSWNTNINGSWENNCADNLANPETTNNNGELTEHAFPELLDATLLGRVQAVLEEGFGANAIAYSAIQDNLDSYFIVNYFGQADYEGTGTAGVPGHIPGAYQFTPYQSLGTDQMLNNLPTDMPIVVYCWTGQHSSQVTAYLNVLGYDAYSLKFGSNNLFHTDLTAHKWTMSQHNDYPLVTD